MKNISFSYLILGAISLWISALQNNSLAKGAKEYFVFSEKGMKLRESPSLESASKVLPYGAKVQVIKFKASEPFEVNRLTGYWSKVEAVDPFYPLSPTYQLNHKQIPSWIPSSLHTSCSSI